MSLGRNRGAAIVGRPLDISIQAILDAQEDPASLCLEADVFYADTRIDRSSVRVSAARSGPGPQDALIQVRSSVLIDEPVVSIYLRAGCLQKSERRYVLLADLVSEPAQQPGAITPSTGAPVRPAIVTPLPVTGAGGAAATGSASGSGQGASSIPGSARPPSPSPRRRGPASTTAPAVAPSGDGSALSGPAGAVSAPTVAPATRAVARNRSVAAQGAERARLKLEPLDLSIDRDPTLRSSTEMLSTPTGNEQERLAAAALWRALTAQPEDLQRDAERLRTLEESINSLRSQTQKNQQAIGDLNTQLQQARDERYANTLVYALGGLLLLALAALLYLWRRGTGRSTGDDELPWWRKGRSADKGWSNSLDAAAPSSSQPGDDDRGRKSGAPVLDLDLGLDNSAYTEVRHLSGHGTNSIPPLQRRDRPDFQMSMAHLSRAVKAEELFDVQQQADFFVSLGQHEQAIQVLRSHIGDNAETSALVYLDLFNLYHQLGRHQEYENLRQDFGNLFNANVPEFDLYTDASAGLEAYEQALSRIESLWPSVKVLDVIEESIFKKAEAGVPPFDLEAYRELLLLYTVAKEILGPDVVRDDEDQKYDLRDSGYDSGNEEKSSRFRSTSIQPLSASMVRHDPNQQDTRPVELSAFPRPSPRLGLDIDLTDIFDSAATSSTSSGTEKADVDADADSRFFDQFVADIEGHDADETRPGAVDPVGTQEPASASFDPGNLIDFETFDSSKPPVAEDEPRKKP